jgi:hypothetical protein
MGEVTTWPLVPNDENPCDGALPWIAAREYPASHIHASACVVEEVLWHANSGLARWLDLLQTAWWVLAGRQGFEPRYRGPESGSPISAGVDPHRFFGFLTPSVRFAPVGFAAFSRSLSHRVSPHDPCDATGSIACTLAHMRRVPPVVEDGPAAAMIGGPFERELLDGAVAAVTENLPKTRFPIGSAESSFRPEKYTGRRQFNSRQLSTE